MKIVVDMNLSPEWAELLMGEGWKAVHWRDVGKPDALDTEILDWARMEQYVVLTQDMDFPQLLFVSQGRLPSVLVLRVRNELDETVQKQVCNVWELPG